jgi:hypothetical protein
VKEIENVLKKIKIILKYDDLEEKVCSKWCKLFKVVKKVKSNNYSLCIVSLIYLKMMDWGFVVVRIIRDG